MILVNAIAWLVIHLSVSVIVSQFPLSVVMSFSKLYQLREWERQGAIYERLKIKQWKNRLPEARKWVNQGKGKTGFRLRNETEYKEFILATNQSELSHWLQIVPAPLFFLFNTPLAGWIIMVYAVSFNLPFIMVQRYNRGRVEKIRLSLQQP
ncbi:glycosyl-4,4'-diaponeurosporenoate acyltransferase CrtO family protein [Halobacillus mangrovi]|uniref:Glycosyl-4,4'-diaponeurosporenoate acyltransferase n=1 Tax=Halobacillus mangrovi TaxID=402384 RepID=A0A1W5ZX45_9BACI|nr:hypothetical protein [Halobacillus mangrovi]ARI77875.1 hypothetical protein HM131_13915 [Halobacillus mangrovi]